MTQHVYTQPYTPDRITSNKLQTLIDDLNKVVDLGKVKYGLRCYNNSIDRRYALTCIDKDAKYQGHNTITNCLTSKQLYHYIQGLFAMAQQLQQPKPRKEISIPNRVTHAVLESLVQVYNETNPPISLNNFNNTYQLYDRSGKVLANGYTHREMYVLLKGMLL